MSYSAAELARIARRLPPHRDEARLSEADSVALGVELADAVRHGTWQPTPARQFTVPKPGGGVRVLGKQARRDRVLHRAILRAAQASDRRPPACVTAYVSGRSAHQTVAWLERRLRAGDRAWSLDVVDFFPSVDLNHLADALKGRKLDELTRGLAVRSLRQPVWQPGHGALRPCAGLLQGGVLSGWLSNIALATIDARFAPTRAYHRYCDNLFFAGDASGVRALAAQVAAALAAHGLRVRLRPARPATAEAGIDCLGYRVSALGRAPGKRQMARFLRRALNRLARQPSAAVQLVRGHRAFYQDRTWRAVMNIDDLLRAGRFAEAREKIHAAQAQLERVDDALSLSADETRRLLRAVRGDPQRHVVEGAGARTIVPRGLTPADMQRHRAGEARLGVLPVDAAGFAHVGVDAQADVSDESATRRDALALAEAARTTGQPALVEATGGRGHHVWLPTPPLPAVEMTRRLIEISAMVKAQSGVRRELFPAPPDSDPAVRLPLGRHPKTGRASTLLDPHGAPLTPRGLTATLRSPHPPSTMRSPAVQAVLDHCPLIAALAAEAQLTADLNHDGRYSLASVLSGLPGGVEAVHHLIGACADYDHAITQHFIDRLHPRPLGCRRLKARHPHLADRCRCPAAARPYPTPTYWARRAPRTPSRRLSRAEMERLLAGVQRSLTRIRSDGADP